MDTVAKATYRGTPLYELKMNDARKEPLSIETANKMNVQATPSSSTINRNNHKVVNVQISPSIPPQSNSPENPQVNPLKE